MAVMIIKMSITTLIYVGVTFLIWKQAMSGARMPVTSTLRSCMRMEVLSSSKTGIIPRLAQWRASGIPSTICILLYWSSPKSFLNASTSFSGQSDTGSSLPVKNLSVAGSCTNLSPPIRSL